ncbi:uncharacterized protein [Haliotis asinina]|uniref:uncharacterized protein n=1 Tax=Haliotis asinina TaxID=109174 RepID=UPI00353247E4
MTHFEEKALASSPIHPVCWFRKVDDTFVILRKDQDSTSLLQHLNTENPRIKFTMETENGNKLPFVDVLVSRDPCNNKIETAVYRKPTHSDQYIHFNSNHPPKIKPGVTSTLTRRAKNICSSNDDIQQELSHLQHVFTNFNQYPYNLVKRTISTTLQDNPKLTKQESAPIRITIPYIGKTCHQISRLLKHQAGIDTIFSGSPTLRTILQANGRNLPFSMQPPKRVIYKINCECGDSYIGETSRPVDTRIKEHKSSTAKVDSKSALSTINKNSPVITSCSTNSKSCQPQTRTSQKGNCWKQPKSGATNL